MRIIPFITRPQTLYSLAPDYQQKGNQLRIYWVGTNSLLDYQPYDCRADRFVMNLQIIFTCPHHFLLLVVFLSFLVGFCCSCCFCFCFFSILTARAPSFQHPRRYRDATRLGEAFDSGCDATYQYFPLNPPLPYTYTHHTKRLVTPTFSLP